MIFRCISCGKEIESEKRCECPECGYSMYETPYERADKLKEEIIHFADMVIGEKVSIDDITFAEKAKDENRFPGFGKINEFICAASTSEAFYERIQRSLTQIKEHLNKEFHKDYTVNLSGVKNTLTYKQGRVTEIFHAFDRTIGFKDTVFPSVKVSHSEVRNDTLYIYAEDILDKLSDLSDKMKKFIKLNSIYGCAYREKVKLTGFPKNNSPEDNLKMIVSEIDNVLGKKYVIDVFDDGIKELSEMLKALWDGLNVIMSSPVLTKSDIYTLGEDTGLDNNIFIEKLNNVLSVPFSEANELIHGELLNDKTEEQLFEIYNSMLDLDEDGYMKAEKGVLLKKGEYEKKLAALIGLNSVKDSIQKIKAYAISNKDSSDLSFHMCFLGNPGTGKTEVARIIAGILHENRLLPSDKVVETDRSGLVAGYVGQTALKTNAIIAEAMGGVLFIDEAYSLVQGDVSEDYGKEAVAALIKAMEDKRGKFCVILAGYKNPMKEMISSNPGFSSRIQFTIDFPNYSRNDLKQIAGLILNDKKYIASESALERILDITDIKRKDPEFANAREMRNILEQVIMCQNVRCMDPNNKTLEIVDVNNYIKDNNIQLQITTESPVNKVMTAEDELDALVGLQSVKRMIKKIKAYGKRNKNDPDINLHMCFCGNPGTGKTQVARILSSILYEAGVLPEAKLTETDSQGLISKYVGETASKTLAKINDAMGGVLFIDEAYSLTQGNDGSPYGDEAVSVLLKQMEDNRGKFCVILAGYKDEMKKLISSNPGLASRVQFTLDFSDYTSDELSQIANIFLHKKKYSIDEDALELVLKILEYYRKQPDFANARTLRNVLEQVIMNQNLRTDELDIKDNNIVLSDVQDYIDDENIDISSSSGIRKIGF